LGGPLRDPSGTREACQTSGSGIRTPLRGLFYINPSRRGPVPVPELRSPGEVLSRGTPGDPVGRPLAPGAVA